MKNLVLFIALVFATSMVVSAQKTENKVVCFKSNMDCASCEKTLTEYLKFEKGVKNLKVDHLSNTVMVEYKADKSSDDVFIKAIEKKGYKAEKISKEDYDKLVLETKGKSNEKGADVNSNKK